MRLYCRAMERRWLGRDASKLEVVYVGLEYGDG
jgi:hypothetical protein